MRLHPWLTLALFALLPTSAVALGPPATAELGGFDRLPAIASDAGGSSPCAPALALASADFDEDGVSDLVVGCADGDAGSVAVYRGDLEALYGIGPAPPRPRAPFLAPAAVFPLSRPAELLAAGDFDGDGHADLVAAARGARALRLLRGNGRGELGAEVRLPLPAPVRELASGDLGRRDGLVDLALELDIAGGTRRLIFQASSGALTRPPREQPSPERTAEPARPGLSSRAMLSLRLNADALPDVVLLEQGASEPVALVSRGAATFTVNSTADTSDGTCDATSCTLREAIQAANANVGADTIAFNIPGGGPHTIGILSDLPNVTEALTIDGRTEPDFVSTPVVVLDGVATSGPSGLAIAIAASGCTVRGLAIHRFNSHDAIALFNNSSGSIVEGNFIGTNAAGTVALGTGSGIDVSSSNGNTIGGTTTAARNLVAGATLPAIIVRNGSSNNTIRGNYLGLDVTGTVPLRNAGNEVAIFDADQNTVGGTTAGASNVVAGNTDATAPSVSVANTDSNGATDASNNLIQGNYIGTDATGNVAIGSASVAVYIQDASNNTVGGLAAGAGNVIGASGLGGVRVLAPTPAGAASGNQILGNRIGVGANGTAPLPIADHGVRFSHGASGNTLEGNLITNAAGNGVLARYDSGSGNRITANRTFGNALLGIDLTASMADPGGPTANDAGDGDGGPNGLQNFPLLTAANHLTNEVSGSLFSMPGASYTIEVFLSPSCDASGHGEGAAFVGTGPVTADGGGQASFTLTATAPLTLGQFVTATATDASGSTSELSACLTISTAIFADGFESGNTSAWSVTVP